MIFVITRRQGSFRHHRRALLGSLVCFITVLLLILLTIVPVQAQEPTPLPSLLTQGVDPITGDIQLVWLNLENQTQQLVTSFQTSSVCAPVALMDGTGLLYEPFMAEGQSPLYQINLNTGENIPVDLAEHESLNCPTVNEAHGQIAWINQTDTTQELITTDLEGQNPSVLATHPNIYDLAWSPDGDILVYTADDDQQTFANIYAYQDDEYILWSRDTGLVTDYQWLQDGSALLVAYTSTEGVILGRLERACIGQESCPVQTLATFEGGYQLTLTDAFSPDHESVIVIGERLQENGFIVSELYQINIINGDMTAITDAPSLTKSSVIWQDTIYYIGSTFDPETFAIIDSGVYRLDENTHESELLYPVNGYLPVTILWSGHR